MVPKWHRDSSQKAHYDHFWLLILPTCLGVTYRPAAASMPEKTPPNTIDETMGAVRHSFWYRKDIDIFWVTKLQNLEGLDTQY